MVSAMRHLDLSVVSTGRACTKSFTLASIRTARGSRSHPPTAALFSSEVGWTRWARGRSERKRTAPRNSLCHVDCSGVLRTERISHSDDVGNKRLTREQRKLKARTYVGVAVQVSLLAVSLWRTVNVCDRLLRTAARSRFGIAVGQAPSTIDERSLAAGLWHAGSATIALRAVAQCKAWPRLQTS